MTQAQATETESITTSPQPGIQTLTPLEIAAVAGGPEGTVGSGLSPP
jgi:hypothetical protein